MILIYSENISTRLEYIVAFIFNTVLNVKYKITNDISVVKSYNSLIINYSNQSISNCININPHSLLFENKIRNIDIDISEWQGIKVFFQTNNNAEIPFDIFAASFYLITRYEEYKTNKKDKFERFIAEESVAFKYGFLDIPIVDIWLLKLKEIIIKKYPQFNFPNKQFTFIPTIDVDNAWAYKHKSFYRTGGGIARSIFKFKWLDLMRRFSVLVLKKKDPYDTYDYINSLHKKYNFKPIYFFLLRNNGKYDTSHNVKNKRFKRLIKNISKKHIIGIHPSYTSNSTAALVKEETAILSAITGEKITRSRSHFLRIKIPHTYRVLIKIGIEEDFSMGYSSQNGFRAGTCNPFLFYNLKQERITNLKIIPFQVMDATFKYYKKFKPQKALENIKYYIEQVKNVDGTFVSIWHNESFSNIGKWKNWRQVYSTMLEECDLFMNS
ncbi:MAG: hypothetical protein GXO79_02890 [Chlorobi bacterium]|nr:hypothetical protein [Chlorobiota bacterium]